MQEKPRTAPPTSWRRRFAHSTTLRVSARVGPSLALWEDHTIHDGCRQQPKPRHCNALLTPIPPQRCIENEAELERKNTYIAALEAEKAAWSKERGGLLARIAELERLLAEAVAKVAQLRGLASADSSPRTIQDLRDELERHC